MANKYIAQNGDVTSLAEPKVYTKAEFSTYYTGETELQKAGSDTTNVVLSGFSITGTACSCVKKGYMPTDKSCFASITSTGTYNISRTNSGITIGSTTYGPSSFRNSFVPYEIFVVLVAGGGGGGGGGSKEIDKDEYERVLGGGGGGGGVVAFRLNLATYTAGATLTVGAGGAAGSDSSVSDAGDGTNGNGGTATSISSKGITGETNKSVTVKCVNSNPATTVLVFDLSAYNPTRIISAKAGSKSHGNVTDLGYTFSLPRNVGGDGWSQADSFAIGFPGGVSNPTATSVTIVMDTGVPGIALAVAQPGAGGGKGYSDGSAGYGGGGGSGSCAVTGGVIGTGGKGNCAANISQSTFNALTVTITSGTGASSTTVAGRKTSDGSTYNVHGPSGRYAGGNSYGFAVNGNSAVQFSAGGVGGGGGAGTAKHKGNNGAAYFYY